MKWIHATTLVLASCLALTACGLEDEAGPVSTSASGTADLAAGNRWTFNQDQSSEASEGNVSSRAAALQSACVPVGRYSTTPVVPCCNSSRAAGRREYRYYCCYGSDAYNAGSASLCCSGSKRSGNYCF